MKIFIIALSILLFFTGCSRTLEYCETNGYKGFVIQKDSASDGTLVYCSNGIVTSDGVGFMTSDDLKSTEKYDFYQFFDKNNGIVIPFVQKD